MRRRHVKDEELPTDLALDLNEHFLQTLHFRFEFARGDLSYVSVSEIFEEDRTGKPRFFRRIHGRRTFLSDRPHQRSYLSELRADLRDAGDRGEEAKSRLRDYVEANCCPLSFCEGVIFHSEPQPAFFPEAWRPRVLARPGAAARKAKARPDASVRAQTRRYCFELFELQDYLIKEVGVKPGSLLPVWVSSEGSPHSPGSCKDMPIISFLPAAQTTVNTLLRYITWEYGSSAGDWYSTIHRIPKGPKKGQRLTTDPTVLRRALLWGRRFLCREVKIMSLGEGTGLSIDQYGALSPEQRKRVVQDAHEGEPDGDIRRGFFADVTHSPEAERLLGIIKGLRSDPRRSRRSAPRKGEPEEPKQDEPEKLLSGLEDKSLDMEKVDVKGRREFLVARNKHLYEGLNRTALPLAEYLYFGGYRNLW